MAGAAARGGRGPQAGRWAGLNVLLESRLHYEAASRPVMFLGNIKGKLSRSDIGDCAFGTSFHTMNVEAPKIVGIVPISRGRKWC
jgi:hypothetical protein